VELLVVITIISMLMGLLLPAVQNAREAGRRATCLNNEKQLALAMQTFESTKRSFPGYVQALIPTAVTTANATPVPVSWVVMLLPYLDHKDIYSNWSTSTAPYSSTTSTSTGTTFATIKLLTCPSDPPPSSGAGDTSLAYVANRGVNNVNDPSLGVCQDQYTAVYIADQTAASASPTARPNLPQCQVGLDYITSHDGASTTLLLAESLLNNPTVSPNLKFGRDASGNSAKWTSTGIGTTYPTPSTANTMEVDVGFEWGTFSTTTTTSGGTAGSQTTTSTAVLTDKIMSRHPGGDVVSFCDGHQSFLANTVDVATFRQLMTPYGAGAYAALTNSTLSFPYSTNITPALTNNTLPTLDEGNY
jgi:type II secretory pathway pseudopilin PulG